MTKPTLGKAWALFYVFQQLTKKEAAPILTQPLELSYPDSNQEMRHQKPLCYHYTIGQSLCHRDFHLKCGANLGMFCETCKNFGNYFVILRSEDSNSFCHVVRECICR